MSSKYISETETRDMRGIKSTQSLKKIDEFADASLDKQ